LYHTSRYDSTSRISIGGSPAVSKFACMAMTSFWISIILWRTQYCANFCTK